MDFDDVNLVVLCGRLASAPDLRVLDSGTRELRLMVTVRAEHPRTRIDVVPVTVFDPPDDLIEADLDVSSRMWIVGSVQRRVDDELFGRQSRLTVVGLGVLLESNVDSCRV